MADGVKKVNESILKDGRVIGITKDIKASKFDGGTLFIHPSDGILKYNNVDGSGTKSWKRFSPSKIFDDNSITRNLLVDNIINASKIENNAIINSKYANSSISYDKLMNNCVITEKIQDFAVTNMKISDFSIDKNKLGSNAVTTIKIEDLAVTSDKIGFKAINNNHIALATISNDRIANKTIDNTKIKDGTIITSLLSNASITDAKIANSNIKSHHIGFSQVGTDHIINKSITSAKVADSAIKDNHFSENSINGNKIFNGSIETVKIADLAISNSKLANKCVDYSKLDNIVKAAIDDAIKVNGATGTAVVDGHMQVKGDLRATGNITGVKVFNPVFADVAEAYIPTIKNIPVGTPVALCKCGGLRVEPVNKNNWDLFLGFVSDNYAACYGATPKEILDGDKIAICLTGRIPVKLKAKKENIGHYAYMSCGKIFTQPFKSSSNIGRIIDIIDEGTVLMLIK